jgi:hypothetical protein
MGKGLKGKRHNSLCSKAETGIKERGIINLCPLIDDTMFVRSLKKCITG